MEEYKFALITPDEEISATISIINEEKIPEVKIGIQYQGKEIWGHGKDYLWVDAFADLQKQLPQGVILKCCLTCRHGNMCPYGNKPGELFCTKDLLITSKADMCNLFDRDSDGSETTKRSKHYTNVCNDFQPQSWDYFTYNDYLYQLSN